MSRNELITQIRSQVSSFPNTQIEQGIWTNEEFNNAMVAAYNRALDDAVEQLMDHDGEVASWQIPDELNKLKI